MPHLPACLPATAGLGFKPAHFTQIRADRRRVGFFEIHAENYMGAGGLPHAQLSALRADHALSVHGVGLSIGGAKPLDRDHLARLKTLCDRYEPENFSEHLAWSSHDGAYLNDLLPLPYTEETLTTVCAHVDQVQETLGRQMLLENPATYVLFAQSTIWPPRPTVPPRSLCARSAMSPHDASIRRRSCRSRRRWVGQPCCGPMSTRNAPATGTEYMAFA